MDKWEKAKIASGFIAALGAFFVPFSAAHIGGVYSDAIKERELQGSFVELAVNILSTEPETETQALREWAILVIDKHSGVPMAPELAETLTTGAALPVPPWP